MTKISWRDDIYNFLKSHAYKVLVISFLFGVLGSVLSIHILLRPESRSELIRLSKVDDVSVSELERVRERIDRLEENQDIRRGYYLDTLSGERIIFGTFLTLIIGLGGFVGFGVFQRRINQIEDGMNDRMSRIRSDLFSKNDEINQKLEGYFNNVKQDVDEIRDDMSDMKTKILRDNSEIFNYIHRKKRFSGSDLDKGDSVLYKTKAILNNASSGAEEEEILDDLDVVKKIVKDMYDEDIGFFKENLENVRENLAELSGLHSGRVESECETILSGLDKMESLEPPLPF